MFKRILIALDDSELSKNALNTGLSFAAALKSEVVLLNVTLPYTALWITSYPFPSTLMPSPEEHSRLCREGAAKILQPGLDEAAQKGIKTKSVVGEHEQPWRGILQTATAENCDLICMASHGRRGFSALLLGSETQKVLTHSHIPVLVVR
jgi:nucleotide-binding universal stress UspA family protein